MGTAPDRREEERVVDESEKVNVDDRAWIGWQMLPAHVKTDIVTSLEPLAGVPPSNWPARILRWRPERNVYVLPVWLRTDEMYVFFAPREQRIHIEGLHLRELIERLSGKEVTGAT